MALLSLLSKSVAFPLVTHVACELITVTVTADRRPVLSLAVYRSPYSQSCCLVAFSASNSCCRMRCGHPLTSHGGEVTKMWASEGQDQMIWQTHMKTSAGGGKCEQIQTASYMDCVRGDASKSVPSVLTDLGKRNITDVFCTAGRSSVNEINVILAARPH